jgi:hypothetical protein
MKIRIVWCGSKEIVNMRIKIKKKVDGSIDRYKARLVAKSFKLRH